MNRRGSAKVAFAGDHSEPADPPISRLISLPIHELGEGRLEPGLPNGRPQRVLRIDVTGAPPNLLGRLLVGSYITGQDQVLITGRDGLSADQRAEVRRAADRLLGMTVVGDTAGSVEVQNFVDPGKHELPHLLHRVVQMLRAELSACRAALAGGEVRRLSVVHDIEQEVDRFYILMVRQLLLSSDDPRIARNIDVESHHYQIGDRMVAKVLEVVGDLICGISTDLQAALPALRHQAPEVVRELETRVHRLDRLLFGSMSAFMQLSIVEANGILNDLAERIPTDAAYGQEIARQVHDRHAAVASQRIACSLDMALEMLVIINEVTINRGVEPVYDIPAGSPSKSGDHTSHARPTSSQTDISILAPKGQKKSQRC